MIAGSSQIAAMVWPMISSAQIDVLGYLSQEDLWTHGSLIAMLLWVQLWEEQLLSAEICPSYKGWVLLSNPC